MRLYVILLSWSHKRLYQCGIIWLINLLILIISLLDYVLDSIGRSLDASSLSVFLVRRAKLARHNQMSTLCRSTLARARVHWRKKESARSLGWSYLSITNLGVNKGLTGVLKHVTANELFLSSFSSRMFMLPSLWPLLVGSGCLRFCPNYITKHLSVLLRWKFVT